MHTGPGRLMMGAILMAASWMAPARGQEIKPFSIHIEDRVLSDLKDRLANTRWPGEIDGAAWEYGVDLGYMKRLVDYWRTDYDWRKA
jgi:hypothetical protein